MTTRLLPVGLIVGVMSGGPCLASAAESRAAAADAPKPVIAQSAPTPAATASPDDAPTTVGLACVSNVCGPQPVGVARPNQAAISAAIRSGNARAAMSAGGTASDVLLAWITAYVRARPAQRAPSGEIAQPFTDRIVVEAAQFVATPDGRLAMRSRMNDGSMVVVTPMALAGTAPPPGTPQLGAFSGSTLITTDGGRVVVSGATPAGGGGRP